VDQIGKSPINVSAATADISGYGINKSHTTGVLPVPLVPVLSNALAGFYPNKTFYIAFSCRQKTNFRGFAPSSKFG
jgi:hypothetical protein